MPVLDATRPQRAVRFTRGLIVLLVAAAVWALGAPAAGAEPPEDPPGPVSRSTQPFAVAYEDPADGLVALGGPPPELGCFGLGFEDNLADFQELQLPSGPMKVLIRDIDQPMFLYQASSIDEICEAVFAGEVPEPLATGTVRVVANDNDVFVSGTRNNAFGHTATGTLLDAAGNPCHFTGQFRAQITVTGEFRLLREDIHLTC
jgi:hypothetical protein